MSCCIPALPRCTLIYDCTELFCDTFRDKMQWLITQAAERINNSSSSNAAGGATGASSSSSGSWMQLKVVEVVQHLTMCRDRSREFRGRQNALCRIRHYLQQQQQQRDGDGGPPVTVTAEPMTADQPIVVYGESGSGKTSVLAKVSSSS